MSIAKHPQTEGVEPTIYIVYALLSHTGSIVIMRNCIIFSPMRLLEYSY